ncbi:MAG: ATP-binding cassette domain-containing protein, partial [Armatimonadota bacterium]
MRDAIEMWKSTKMIVLTAVIAAVYAAILIPFKAVPGIPGITEFRPANVIPIVCSLLFGPAAAWGAAFGNLIGDFFGTMGPGSAFGFVGNFIYGYLPYRLWRALFPRDEARGAAGQLPQFLLVSIVASIACAVTIAPGVELLGLIPDAFRVLGIAITANNGIVSCVLGPILMPLVYPRVKRWGLLCGDVMEEADIASGPVAPLGAVLTTVGSCTALMLAIIQPRMGVPVLAAGAVCVLVLLAGAVLMGRVRASAPIGLFGGCAALVLACSPLHWGLRVALPIAVLAVASALARRALPDGWTRGALDAGKSAATSGELAVAMREVVFRYPTAERPALSGVSFQQPVGQFVAVAGRTGAGKSTMSLCLNGLVPKFVHGEFSGTVRVLGRDVAGLRVPEVARLVGIVFQDFETQLFSSDVRSEVAFAMENHGVSQREMAQRVAACLRTVGLQGFEDREPSTLSGGEKQRLASASVWAAEPDVLLLDEPTTDLDPAGRREVLAVVSELRHEGRTAILVEHEPEDLIGADRLVVLDEGAVSFDGPPSEMLSDPARTTRAGLRALDVPQLFEALGRKERPLTVDDALALLRPEVEPGFAQAGRALRRKDQERSARYGDVYVSCRDVHFDYEGSAALWGVSLEVRRGEFVAILGRNGCGKTTLAKHLNGLLRPKQGVVEVGGLNTDRVPSSELARRVAYVFQNPDHQIFLERVDEEVAFGLRNVGAPDEERRVRTIEALKAVRLLDKADEDPFSLTKGERQ